MRYIYLILLGLKFLLIGYVYIIIAKKIGDLNGWYLSYSGENEEKFWILKAYKEFSEIDIFSRRGK